jgi:hypothetical protein
MRGVCRIGLDVGAYRQAMTDPSKPVGFNLDFDQVLRDLTKTRRRRTRPATNDMDAAVRRAVRTEMDDVERTLKALVAEIARLRKANEDLLDKLDRLSRR